MESCWMALRMSAWDISISSGIVFLVSFGVILKVLREGFVETGVTRPPVHYVLIV